ncbi:MAG: LamG domain-containing protein [Chromatiales bacterium]|nr:LamG domain-containing protein [Chromatiales bacterium]
MKQLITRTLKLRALAIAGLALAVTACGGGAETQTNQQVTPPVTGSYTGPAPATEDTQAFMINLWENLRQANRCGTCHGADNQTPFFARSDDVNLAYQAIGGLVNLASPGESVLVTRVAGGHNCWLTSDQACADILATWIGNWAGGEASGGREIELTAPPLKQVGASRILPGDPALFAQTVYPVLTAYCATCHSGSVANAQSPFFADADLDTAYAASLSRLDLDNPQLSRFVVRLGSEFHNCWGDCASNAQQMTSAIQAMANDVPLSEIDPALVTSFALGLGDGIVAAGGNRFEAHQIAFWEFKEGQGSTAFDTSGVEPAINLTLSGEVSWFGGWGIDIQSGKAQGSTAASRKLYDLIRATGEYSIEAWVVPGNVTQEDARIISYSAGPQARNFTLGQTQYQYDFANRSTATNANGMPVLSTPAAAEVLQATLQHVVVTWDPVNGRRVHVNGQQVQVNDGSGGGLLTDWDDSFAFVLGNEPSGDRQWQGVLRLVAVHNRALNTQQIQQNMDAGVGEKFFLLFNVSEHVGLPDSYILMQASQFDSYAYLFVEPRFISLDPDVVPSSIPLRGVRIGINGAVPAVGQAFSAIDTTIGSAGYDPGLGQLLSGQGAVIGLQNGPASDEFFLSFEVLGNSSNIVTTPAPLQPPAVADRPPQPDIGLRTFDRINATMSQVTGIPATNSAVAATFNLVRQQLPTIDALDTFVSAHQIGVTQLAIEYCNVLLEDPQRRAAFFPGFDFDAAPDTALAGSSRWLLLDPLIDRMMGVGLNAQPDFFEVRGELSSLVDRLNNCGGASCPVSRTVQIGKASCAAMLGSAPMLLH